MIPNVLAARYASPELVALWSPESKVVLERRLWIAVLRAQRDLGIPVPDGVDRRTTSASSTHVDLASIAARERVTRHDVKARIEEFAALAGHEHIHKGMTSRDLTENVEQLQIRLSLEHVRDRTVAVLARLARRAAEYAELVMAGRSHNVAAQATTLGKRFASAADELLVAYDAAGGAARPLPAARDQGPDGHRAGHARPPRRRRRTARRPRTPRRRAPRLPRVLDSVGQVYPRSLDFDVVTALAAARRGPVVAGHHDPADGGPRARHRGLPARPGRQLGHAAQDELPLHRADQRADGAAARLRGHGRRAGRGAVERGRRVRLGRAPGRAARRVLRPRRAVRDLPDRARRARRLPRRDRPRAGPLPAVPRDDGGAHGRGAGGRRPGDRARGDQGARRGASRWRCGRRARPRTTCWPASPPTSASPRSTLPDPLAFTGAATAQVTAVVARVDAIVAAHPDAAAYTPGAIL